MLEIILIAAASMGAGTVVRNVAKACGAPQPVANMLGSLVSNLVGAEMNGHHDSSDPGQSTGHDTHRAG